MISSHMQTNGLISLKICGEVIIFHTKLKTHMENLDHTLVSSIREII